MGLRVVLAGGLLLLAGCGHDVAATPITAAPLPATADLTSPPPTPTRTPTSVSPSTSSGPACMVDRLRISPFVEGTAQDAFVTLTVTDAGGSCVLDGDFDAAGYVGDTEVFGAAGQSGTASPIHLTAEQHVTVQVTFVATTSCPTIDTLRITPPGQSAYAAVPLGQAVHACAGATISPPQGP